MQLSLVVIRTHQPERVKGFYEALGLQFREEKHGNGPVHFSAGVGQTVFEVYPLPTSIEKVDATTRLSFTQRMKNSLCRSGMHLEESKKLASLEALTFA